MSTEPVKPIDSVYPTVLAQAEARLIEKRRKAAGLVSGPIAPGPQTDTRVAAALSGGGIRSATFSLGAFQALAERGLLRRIDILSTVSGGGYFGAFLGRLFTRRWINSEENGKEPGNDAESPDLPPLDAGWLKTLNNPVARVEAVLSRASSWCVRYLRDNGRYLSPNGSGDAWMAVAIFLRNWISILFVLVTFAATAFLLLTLIRALLWDMRWFQAVEALLLGASASHLWWSPLLVLPGLILAAVVVPSAWAYWLTQTTWSQVGRALFGVPRWLHENVARVVPALVFVAALAVANRSLGDTDTGFTFWASLAIALEAGLALVFYWTLWLIEPKLHTATPSGTTERKRRDQYWIRNRLSSLLATAVALTAATLALAFLDSLGQSAYALFFHEEGLIQPLQVLAGVSGLAGLAAAARRIMFLLERLPKGRPVQMPLNLVAGFAAAILLLGLLTAASVGSHAVAWKGAAPAPQLGMAAPVFPGENLATQLLPSEMVRLSAQNYIEVVPARKLAPVTEGSPKPSAPVLTVAFGVMVVVCLLMGQALAFINLSSFHAFYTARLTRAFLGASNPARWLTPAVAGKPRSLFGDDGRRISVPVPGDDLPWDRYQPWLAGGPLHIVNMTLNETVIGKSQIEYRDRKGLVMAIGPEALTVGRHDHAQWGRHPNATAAVTSAGENPAKGRYVTVTPLNTVRGEFHALGLPRSEPGVQAFGVPHDCEKLGVGRCVGISGAAFSTGLGYRTSLGKSLLMGLFNVRLGYWWTSGIDPDERGDTRTRPTLSGRIEAALATAFPAQMHLIGELTARFHGPTLRRWYLTDGGHFENTAVYELIRRKVPFIVVCDCGCDPDYQFEDLSNLVRIARIDFGAEIEFLDDAALEKLRVHPQVRALIGTPEQFRIARRRAGKTGRRPMRTAKHALLARVRYSGAADGTGASGHPPSFMLVLKPSLSGDEPADVLHYQSRMADFPNESTADQYFDEAQWESYRQLGYHTARLLFEDFPSLEEEGEKGPRYWRPCTMSAPGEPATGA